MIQFLPQVELADFEQVRYVGTEVVAVARVRVAGADVEPLLLTIDESGGLRIEAEVEFAGALNLHAEFGGLRFTSLPELTRSRITRVIVDRAIAVFTEGDAT